MTLLWCLAAILAALIIARYNQSNKLFWILMISFLTGIAGAAVYDKLSNDDKNQSKEQLTQVCPTQGTDILTQIIYYLEPTSVIASRLEPAHVSQDLTPEYYERSIALSKRVIPTYTPPPQHNIIYDTS